MTVRSCGATREVRMVSRTEMLEVSCPRQIMMMLTRLRETTMVSVEMIRSASGRSMWSKCKSGCSGVVNVVEQWIIFTGRLDRLAMASPGNCHAR